MTRYAKILPRNDKLRKIIAEHGEYFEVVKGPVHVPQLGNQLGVTLKDPNYVFTTEVKNIRIIQPE